MEDSNYPLIGHEFIKKWLEIPEKLKGAQDQDNDYIKYNDYFRFFCFYLAFNHIFDCYEKKHKIKHPFFEKERPNEYWEPDERERILHLVNEAFKRIRKNYDCEEWKAFDKNIDAILLAPVVKRDNTPDLSEIREIKECHLKYNNQEHRYIEELAKILESSKDEGIIFRCKIQMVFLRIYQVRCNLFHGVKDPNDERDMKLVKTSADVLERFLWFCTNDASCYGIIF